MCLGKIWLLELMTVTSLILTGCYAPPSFELDREAQDQMMKLPDVIDMELTSGTFGGANVFRYTITRGKLALAKKYKIPPVPPDTLEETPRIIFEKEVPEGMPKLPGYRYYGHYRISPNNSHIALSIAPENVYYSKGFVIVRQDTKEVTFRKEYNDDKLYTVGDVAWSPDSSMLAVLEYSCRRRHGLVDVISAAVGHPNEVCTFYLSIYNSEGQLLVSSHLASGLVNPTYCMYWRQR